MSWREVQLQEEAANLSTTPPLLKVSGEPRHILSLDGFRGLAVLAVVTFHFLPHPGLGYLAILPAFGWTGVDAFLVLSGFLITGILYKQRGAPHYFRNFYVRRALRLFPLYYFILFLAIATSLFWGHPWRLGHAGFLFYAANIVLVHDQSFGDLGIFNMRHFWTLALEEQFYLLWPWLVGSLLSRKALLRCCAACIVIAIALRFILFSAGISIWMSYYSLPTRMDSLLIGAAIALMPLPSKTRARWLLGVSAAVYVGLVVAGGNSLFTSPPIVLTGYTVLALFYGALLILALHPGTLTARVLATSPMRFLGRLSYGIYLWHFLLGNQALDFARKLQLDVHPPLLASLVAYVVTFGLSILAAFASYHVIELPFLRLKRRFEAAPPPVERQVV